MDIITEVFDLLNFSKWTYAEWEEAWLLLVEQGLSWQLTYPDSVYRITDYVPE